jgi:predicted AlkP superfamily pyrophosphatase or phosphodiesterase
MLFGLAIHAKPRVTVVFVIDQLGDNYIQKLRPYLSHGFSELINDGVYYTNAFFEHSMPATAAGHTMISTGTFANYHGVVSNSWFNKKGKRVRFGADNSCDAATFSRNGVYKNGMSAHHLMADTLSDQIVMNNFAKHNTNVWALSLKSRAAIACAGRLGKAVWFDTKEGRFTSSKAYFDKLPEWITSFNKDAGIDKTKEYKWEPFYKPDTHKYDLPFMHDHTYTIDPEPVFNTTLKIDHSKDKPFSFYAKTPHADKYLMKLARKCLDEYTPESEHDGLVLYVSLSGLDKIGHYYGPYSKESVDTIYHMDKMIKEFMDYTYTKIDPKDVLFVCTADHGIMPIVEVLNKHKFSLAKRLNPFDVIDSINQAVEKKFNIKKAVAHFIEQHLYFNNETMPQEKNIRTEISSFIIEHLKNIQGVRNAWTFDELSRLYLDPTFNLDIFIQRQLYKSRSGDIIYSLDPYTYMSSYHGVADRGTSHTTPFAYDTHVPLILYQKGSIEHKVIAQNVGMQQLAPTMAQILNVPRPSASRSSVLPGIDYHV